MSKEKMPQELPLRDLIREVLKVLRERAENQFQTLLLPARDEKQSQQQ